MALLQCISWQHVEFSFLLNSVNELLKIKDELTKERDEKLSEVTKLRGELSGATAKQQKAEQDREEAEMKIAEVCYLIYCVGQSKSIPTPTPFSTLP